MHMLYCLATCAATLDVDIQRTQRLVQLSEVCLWFLPPEPQKMAANINVTERNTLPVLYNINSSTVILPYHQQYIYIAIYTHISVT